MGNESGEAAAPQPAPAPAAEPVTVKPADVSRDPEQITEDPAPRNVDPSTEAEIDRDAKPSRPKQKRRAKPDAADVADQRSPGGRSKASKLAKGSKPEIDAVSVFQGSESSPRRPQVQPEDTIRKASRDRDATSPAATRVTARDVPLPPRLPHAGRPVRTAVTKAVPNTAEGRASAGAKLPVRAPESVQADVPHPAKATLATSAPEPSTKIDTATKGVAGDGVATSPAFLTGLSVAPAKDAREQTTPAVPSTDDPRRAAPDSAVANAKPSPDTVAATPAASSQGSAARVVVPQPGGDTIAAVAVPQIVTPSGPATTPNAVVEAPRVTVERPVVAEPPPPAEARAVVSLPNPDKSAAPVAAPSPAVTTSAAAPKDATITPPHDAAVVGQTALPSLPEGQTPRPASKTDSPAAGVALQDAVPPTAVVTGEPAAGRAPPAPSQGAEVVGTNTVPPPPAGRVVEPVPEPTQVAGAAPQAAVPPEAVMTGAAAPKDAPTTSSVDAAVVDSAPPSREGPAVNAASEPDALASGVTLHAAVPPAVVEPAPTVAPQPLAMTRNDDASRSVARSSEPPMPAVSALPVPVPGQASLRDSIAPMTAMNEPQPPASTQNTPASPEAAHESTVARGGEAERLASSPSHLAKPAVSGYGALGKIDNNLRPPPSETAALVVTPPPATAPTDENPANLVKIAVGDVSTKPEGTAIAYTITNTAAAPVDLLFIRCNAVDRKGTVVGSAFDYVENIPAGQQVQRTVRMSSEVTASSQTFSCANDAATQ